MSRPLVLLATRESALQHAVQEAIAPLSRVNFKVVLSADPEICLKSPGLALLIGHLADPQDLPALSGLIRAVSQNRRPIPTLVIGELHEAERGLKLLQLGAADYLERPLNIRHLTYLVEMLTLRAAQLPPEPADVPEVALTGGAIALGQKRDFLFNPGSPMAAIVAHVRSVAPLDTTILLQGETGTGKSQLAKIIHEMSARSKKAFRAINCASLSETLIESELFGHVRGAFTGADRDRAGMLTDVGDGTVFLDEVDSLNLGTQAKLLRALEDREYQAVGSNKVLLMTARVIAAANRDLKSMVEAGQFRKDLYYRLNVVSFLMPALRDRPHVFSALVEKFVQHFATRANRDIRGLTPAADRAMRVYSWPGNIRELRNAIERAVALRSSGPIEVGDLPDPIRQIAADPVVAGLPHAATLNEAKDIAEATIISETLRKHNNNRMQTAAALGISRMTLYNKLHRLGLA